MRKLFSLPLYGLVLSLASPASMALTLPAPDAYEAFRSILERGGDVSALGLTRADAKYLVDALWDMVAEDQLGDRAAEALRRWEAIDASAFEAPERVRMLLLGLKLQARQAQLGKVRNLVRTSLSGSLDRRTLVIIFNHTQALKNGGLAAEITEVELRNSEFLRSYRAIIGARSDEASLEDPASIIQDSKSAGTVVFVACRPDRSQPCLLTIRQKNSKFLLSGGGAFNLPALAYSRLGLPFHHENGETPAGVYFIDGVMPIADKQLEFGRNRRLILNFADETAVKNILPPSELEKNWWRESLLAKTLGRTNLRAHGTGMRNTDPASTHPYLVPSVGCLKLREGSYPERNFDDQRLLLDALMRAQGLPVKATNETQIRATLVIFHVSGAGAVTLDEIEPMLNL